MVPYGPDHTAAGGNRRRVVDVSGKMDRHPPMAMADTKTPRRALLVGVPLLALAIAAVVAFVVFRGPPPVPIRVDGQQMLVDEGTTFGSLLASEHLEARNGRLLDVDGGILQRRHDPGRILLNGLEPPSRGVLLADGDRIDVLDGKDETEPTVRTTRRLGTLQAPNPARTLGRGPSDITTVRGQLSNLLVRSTIRRVGPIEQPNAVALTFDDGPWPNHTAKILSILERMKVKATFFVVGSWAERYPMLVRRARAMGMQIGSHSWSHPYDPPFDSLPTQKVEREIADTDALLDRLGIHTGLFRPPGGSWDAEVRDIARSYGMRLVLWDVDPHDWMAKTSPKELVKTVLARVRPGSVILLHDGGGDAATTIEALPEIIAGIRKKGLGFTTL